MQKLTVGNIFWTWLPEQYQTTWRRLPKHCRNVVNKNHTMQSVHIPEKDNGETYSHLQKKKGFKKQKKILLYCLNKLDHLEKNTNHERKKYKSEYLQGNLTDDTKLEQHEDKDKISRQKK